MQDKIKNISSYNLKKQESRLIINKILEDILKQKIRKLNFLGLKSLKQIPEYNFNLSKIEVIIENNRKYDVYLKNINKSKIQETIFCYWYFCEENYKIKTNKKEKYYAKKATITEYKNQYDRKKYNIKFLGKQYKIHKSSNLYFINIKKYIGNFLGKEKDIILKNKQIEDKILFIGIV